MIESHHGYPCPACRAAADLVNGCSGCGLPPDPVAAEVVSLNETINLLAGRERQYQQELAALQRQLAESRQRREQLAAQVRAATPAAVTASQAAVDPAKPDPVELSRAVPAPVAPDSTPPDLVDPSPAVPAPAVTGGGPPAADAPAGRPAAGRTGRPPAEVRGSQVQTLLFVIGGLLLGTGAVVFMVVAWTRFGVVGRAGTLLAATAIALVVPAVARRRRLPGTAETLAVIGMLLVLLDGYAAWRAGLAPQLPASSWVGLVAAGTALVSLGYARLTGLVAPKFVALVLAQWVLPALAWRLAWESATLTAGLVVLSLAGAVTAAGGLLVCRRLRSATGASAGLRVVSWVAVAAALAGAGLAAVLAVGLAEDPVSAGLAGAGLLTAAAVLVLVAVVAGGGGWTSVAAAVAVAGTALAGSRVAALSWPDSALASVAATVTLVALVAALIAARPARRSGARSPATPHPQLAPAAAGPHPVPPLCRGARIGGLVAAAPVAAGAAALSGWAGLSAAWQAPGRPATLTVAEWYDWQVPAALVLTTVALIGLLPARRAALAGAGLVLLVFAVPVAWGLPWWSPLALALPVATGLSLLTAPAANRRTAVSGTVAAAGLVLYALLVGSAEPGGVAAVLGLLVLLGPAVAVRAATAGGRSGRVISRAWLLAGLLAWPGAVAATAAVVQIDAPWPGRLALLAMAGLLAVVAFTRARAPRYAGTVGLAVHGITPVAVLAGLGEAGAPGSAYPAVATVILYTGVAVLVLAGLGLLRPPALPDRWAVTRVPPLVLLVVLVAAPLASLLFGPYGWLGRIWSGRPTGVGLLVGDALEVSAPVPAGLSLVAIAAAIAGRVLTGRWRAGVVTGSVVGSVPLLVGLVWLAPPWPVVPAASLLLGAGTVWWAARRAAGVAAGVTGGYGSLLIGAGIAGALPLRWSTVVALAVAGAVAVVAAVAGRTTAARIAGWSAIATFGVLLAVAATRAVAAPEPATGLAVLAVAGALLAASAAIPANAVSAADAVNAADAAGAADAAVPAGSPAVRTGRVERLVAEVAAHAVAVTALLLSLGWLTGAAVIATGWAVAVGLRAARAGGSAGARAVRVAGAAGSLLLAWWLLLADRQVALVEAYTVPAALLGLAVAGWLRRRHPIGSWPTYGLPLLAGLAPTLALTLVDPLPLRRLALGGAALLVLLAGARWRLQAPVVIGGGLAVLAGLRELVLVWQQLDAWIPLTVAGLLLVGLAATYERRRRDLRVLRASLRRMS